jgi:hypothetical protein
MGSHCFFDFPCAPSVPRGFFVALGAILAVAGCAPAPETASPSAKVIETEIVDGATGPTILLRQPSQKGTQATFVVTGLQPGQLEELAKIKDELIKWNALFAVSVRSERKSEDRPPMLGSYRIEHGTVVFEPRFPLERAIHYQAVFNPSRLPNAARTEEKPIVAEFVIPKPKTIPTTEVDHVYPSVNLLPENQLKFYIHFSAPMSRGESYRHFHLLKSGGDEVDLPFLELGEELWDRAGKRFTLFFDPGRIKRGLKPRAELGPALEEGKSFILVIDRDWPDADGNPLKESFRKSFRVGPPDDQPPELKTWKIQSPSAETMQPLIVRFPKPIDHALLQRMIWVVDGAGRKLEGQVEVSNEETRWQFTPHCIWQTEDYHLIVDAALEDLAGNSIGRPFEVDVFQPIQREVKKELIKLPFQVKKPKREE